MYLSKEKLAEISAKHGTLIILDSDAAEALEFAYDVMIAESDAIKEREPDATNAIDRLERSAYELYEVFHDVESDNFSEGG